MGPTYSNQRFFDEGEKSAVMRERSAILARSHRLPSQTDTAACLPLYVLYNVPMPVLRQTEIHQRRVRRNKLAKLRKKYAETKSTSEREMILAKASRIAPWFTSDAFVKLVKKA